jgi:hypothetical protein
VRLSSWACTSTQAVCPADPDAADTRRARQPRAVRTTRDEAYGRHRLDNDLLKPLPANSNADGSIQCRERPGGILNHYYREAA